MVYFLEGGDFEKVRFRVYFFSYFGGRGLEFGFFVYMVVFFIF